MKSFGKSKIGRRIVALVLVSVTLSIVTLTGSFLWLQLRESIDSKRAGIQATGYVFASAIADEVATGDQQAVFNALRSIRRVPDVRYVIAIDAEGREIASLGTALMLQSDIIDESTSWSSLLTRGWFPVVTEIVKAGRPVGRLIIVADVSSLRTQVVETAMVTLFAALAAGGLGVAAAIRLQRGITGPIASLTRAMTHIRSARDYSHKVEHESDDETGVLVDAFNGMISEIGYRDESMRRLAYFDPLTGLANRGAFQRHLETILSDIKDAKTGAVLFLLDLDQFKTINDSYGHSAGDSLLMDVAARFKTECNDNLFLVRLGGDEFAVVATGIKTESDAQDAVAPLVASLLRPVDIFGRQILIGMSVGIVMIPRDGNTTADLLRRADLALYQAKREGRGRVVFYRPWLDEDVQFRTSLAQDLRHAIELGQLEAHYQPQVNIHTGEIDGFESLMRWKHSIHGHVSPAIFIPIAESNGLICDLGHWILLESCRQAKTWIDQGLDVKKISVNVSVAQIRQIGFEREVEKILQETLLPSSVLCLELTESLFADTSLRRVRDVLDRLKSIGIKLAIDDFGTGYSSLSYLDGLPFDELKIDRAFVNGIGTNASKHPLLKGMIELSHALDLSVVAEGAETEEEVAVLRDMGADRVQGYVFSKPVAAADVPAAVQSIQAWYQKQTQMLPIPETDRRPA
ncbi:MAG TPA: EAL domain-containing protein [Aestuariivirga sp.]